MKLGVHVGDWGFGNSPEEQLAFAAEAERLGFDSVWVAESSATDSAAILTWLASHTTRIRLGAGIMHIAARSAAMTAMSATTVDRLSGGRMVLGLGVSGPAVSEGWHGVRFAPQLQRTREYIAVVRAALSGAPVRFRGETIELPMPDGPGVPMRLAIAPVQERLPIYLAAIGPRNVALAGEVADGLLPVYFSPEHARHFWEPLQEGAARAGRSLDAYPVCPTTQVLIRDDAASARDELRPLMARFIGGAGTFYNRLISRYGFVAVAEQVRELFLAGRVHEADRAVPDELVDHVSIAGPPDHARERVRAMRDAGVDTLIVSPMGRDADERFAQLALVSSLVAEVQRV
jgi:F420-dependent oxidoreductase-like protein